MWRMLIGVVLISMAASAALSALGGGDALAPSAQIEQAAFDLPGHDGPCGHCAETHVHALDVRLLAPRFDAPPKDPLHISEDLSAEQCGAAGVLRPPILQA